MEHLKTFLEKKKERFHPPLPGGGMDEEAGKEQESDPDYQKKIDKELKKFSKNMRRERKGKKPIITKK